MDIHILKREKKFSGPDKHCPRNVTDLAGSLVTNSRPPGRLQERPIDQTGRSGCRTLERVRHRSALLMMWFQVPCVGVSGAGSNKACSAQPACRFSHSNCRQLSRHCPQRGSRRPRSESTFGLMCHTQVLAYKHTDTCFTALFPGLPGWAGTREVKPIWILLKQKTTSGSGISWAICKSAPRFRQITMPAPHHSAFYSPGALLAAQPTASKH